MGSQSVGCFAKPIIMKALTIALAVLLCLQANAQREQSQNIFIITTDGFRWQEVFEGANENLVRNPKYVNDTSLITEMYWDEDPTARRSKLMPFLWNMIAKKGQIYGNRNYGNYVNVKNIYKFSYPGYNEILTGYADLRFIPNKPVNNKNINILEYLNKQEAYKGKVVAFSSWNILPYIINEERSNIPVNGGYEGFRSADSSSLFQLINQVQDNVANKESTRHDELTYFYAKEYIKQQHPKVAFIGFGETDEYAHSSRYDSYLHAANKVDRMIAELWYFVQNDPFYRNNTTFIITTDHGRGSKASTWNQHNTFVKGSGDAWIALLGAGIEPVGEIKAEQQVYQKQIASTITMLLGQTFQVDHPVGSPIKLPSNSNNAALASNTVK